MEDVVGNIVRLQFANVIALGTSPRPLQLAEGEVYALAAHPVLDDPFHGLLHRVGFDADKARSPLLRHQKELISRLIGLPLTARTLDYENLPLKIEASNSYHMQGRVVPILDLIVPGGKVDCHVVIEPSEEIFRWILQVELVSGGPIVNVTKVIGIERRGLRRQGIVLVLTRVVIKAHTDRRVLPKLLEH